MKGLDEFVSEVIISDSSETVERGHQVQKIKFLEGSHIV